MHQFAGGSGLRGPRGRQRASGRGQRGPPGGGRPIGSADPDPAHLGTAFRRGGAEPILPQSPRANCSLHPREPTFPTYLRRGRGRLHSSHHIHNQHSTFKALGHYLFLVFPFKLLERELGELSRRAWLLGEKLGYE